MRVTNSKSPETSTIDQGKSIPAEDSGSSSCQPEDEPTRKAAHPSRATSCDNFAELQAATFKQPLKKRMKRSESEFFFQNSTFPTTSQAKLTKPASVLSQPEDVLASLLKSMGVSLDSILVADYFFMPIAKQNRDTYPQAAQAARNEDLEALKTLHRQGLDLQCSNNYGESVLHIVCRRGHDGMLKFLTEEAKVSVWVRDDLGRTPLHDAAWTDAPNFDLVHHLLVIAPNMLFAKDKRGHYAFSYIPMQRRGLWSSFLLDNQDLVQLAIELNSSR